MPVRPGLWLQLWQAGNGAAVTILEQNERPGKKICATGYGKCNYTNLVMPEDAYRGTHPEFVNDALSQFSVEDTVEFFKKIGIYPLNKNGYLYPRSGQAQSVVEVLCMEAASLGVKIKTNEQAVSIEKNKSGRQDKTGKKFTVLTKGWHYEADAVFLPMVPGLLPSPVRTEAGMSWQKNWDIRLFRCIRH